MNVKLLTYTPEPEKVIAVAARICYSNKADINTIAEGFTKKEIENFIRQLMESRHFSTLEHVSFTFGIEGISRVVSHEVARHRIGVAISQRSQRYCSEEGCFFICPDTIGANEESEAYSTSRNSVEASEKVYKHLIKLGIPKEDARYVLPNATETRMILTMNARELLHFFSLRCCTRALPEMRNMAFAMLEAVKPVAPTLFVNAGPSCVQMGYCPEGKMACGRAPTLDQLLSVWRDG